jgi:hypothetical protein
MRLASLSEAELEACRQALLDQRAKRWRANLLVCSAVYVAASGHGEALVQAALRLVS